MDALTRHARDAGLASATWTALGCTARLVCTEAAALDAARAVAARVVASVDETASRFRRNSELTTIHRRGPGAVEVSPLLGHLLRVALDAAAWSDGLLDPTVGAVMNDLGYDRTFRLVPADGPAVVLTSQAVPGWQQVSLDGSRLHVPRGVGLDLGATAKSVAADLAARDAAEASGAGVLVSLGGDIAVAGPAPQGGWAIQVTDVSEPERGSASGASSQTVAISTGGLATSGITARRWRRGGSMLHHIIDPRIGLPAAGPWADRQRQRDNVCARRLRGHHRHHPGCRCSRLAHRPWTPRPPGGPRRHGHDDARLATRMNGSILQRVCRLRRWLTPLMRNPSARDRPAATAGASAVSGPRVAW